MGVGRASTTLKFREQNTEISIRIATASTALPFTARFHARWSLCLSLPNCKAETATFNLSYYKDIE